MIEQPHEKFKVWEAEFGTRVIIRSSENEPYQVGELKDFLNTGYSSVPLVVFDDDPNEKICMGIVLPYSEELVDFLDVQEPKKQWEILKQISIAIQIAKN